MGWPDRPAVSTVIVGVPWPEMILPAEMTQLKTGVTPAVPPLIEAVKVTGVPACCTSGQLMVTFGQTGRGGGQARTTTFVEVNAVQSGLSTGPLSIVTAAL